MKLNFQDLSLAWAPFKALGGAINKYSLRNFVFFFVKKAHKIA
jgi:hypothetical protein